MSRPAAYLTIALLALTLAGCGNDQYSMEKRFWNAQKQAEKIYNNPAASPPNELKRVVGILSGFAKDYPKSSLAIEAQFHIARLYMATKEYNGLRSYLNSLIEKYKNNPLVGSEAMFMIGNSYEREGNWDKALATYKRLINDYGITPRGTSTPLYIAKYYKSKFDPEKMREALKEAIAHYQMMAERYPNSPFAYTCQNLIAQCYAGLTEWPKVIETYDTILEKYKGKVAMDEILLNKSVVYAEQMNQPEKAGESLNLLLKDYPKSRFAGFAKKFLEKLSRNKK